MNIYIKQLNHNTDSQKYSCGSFLLFNNTLAGRVKWRDHFTNRTFTLTNVDQLEENSIGYSIKGSITIICF